MVRQGIRAWMVYDRKIRGPAKLADAHLATLLTREEADELKAQLEARHPESRAKG